MRRDAIHTAVCDSVTRFRRNTQNFLFTCGARRLGMLHTPSFKKVSRSPNRLSSDCPRTRITCRTGSGSRLSDHLATSLQAQGRSCLAKACILDNPVPRLALFIYFYQWARATRAAVTASGDTRNAREGSPRNLRSRSLCYMRSPPSPTTRLAGCKRKLCRMILTSSREMKPENL